MDAITLKRARKELQTLVERVNEDAEPTIICGEGGERAVLMSLDEFNAWQETLYLLSNPANAERLRESIAQVQAGKTVERKLIDP